MHTVTATRTIDTPVAAVWNAIDDFGNVYRYNPLVEHSESINDTTTGKGAKRQCDLYDGGILREEIIESVPEQRLVVNAYDLGSFPLKENVTHVHLESVAENSTEVTFTMSFVPKYGPVGWLLATLMMKRQFRAMAEDILAGLDTHLQTGETIGPDGSPEPAPDQAHEPPAMGA